MAQHLEFKLTNDEQNNNEQVGEEDDDQEENGPVDIVSIIFTVSTRHLRFQLTNGEQNDNKQDEEENDGEADANQDNDESGNNVGTISVSAQYNLISDEIG